MGKAKQKKKKTSEKNVADITQIAGVMQVEKSVLMPSHCIIEGKRR